MYKNNQNNTQMQYCGPGQPYYSLKCISSQKALQLYSKVNDEKIKIDMFDIVAENYDRNLEKIIKILMIG